jgi:hypothetical protein
VDLLGAILTVDKVFGNEMRRELPCLQNIWKLGWINHYTSSVLRGKIEKFKYEKATKTLRPVAIFESIMVCIFNL